MRTLALETSSSTGSIALLEDDRVVAETDLGGADKGHGQRTAQSLAPALQSILREAKWEPRDVQLIAVTDGPGSFTGLRAGVTTAKVFAYATGAEVVAVNTLEVVAAQANVVSERLWAVMDAQRQQVFAAQFALAAGTVPHFVLATNIVDNEAWLQQLVAGDSVIGTGLAKLAKRLPADVQVVSQERWAAQAVTLGRLAVAKYQSGQRSDFWKLAPQYFRKSAAEEKFDQGLLK
ncbi:MAG: tRNA (adenosine(37)-N6)-threonylcarbamoyltransferase complex dimerization subunit type 1 TsaB [Planctomycetota bacterium]